MRRGANRGSAALAVASSGGQLVGFRVRSGMPGQRFGGRALRRLRGGIGRDQSMAGPSSAVRSRPHHTGLRAQDHDCAQETPPRRRTTSLLAPVNGPTPAPARRFPTTLCHPPAQNKGGSTPRARCCFLVGMTAPPTSNASAPPRAPTSREAPALARRGYSAVTVAANPHAGLAFCVLLDGKPVRTPAKRVLDLPTR